MRPHFSWPRMAAGPAAVVPLLLAASVAFAASLGAGFLFDDRSLFSDPVINDPAGWWKVWRLHQPRPLTWFTFWLNEQVPGHDGAPALWHAFNLALHLTSVWLLHGCLRRLLGPAAAFAGTLLFAVHPIQTEPVVYVFARGTLLATLLCLASWRDWLSARHWRAAAWFAAALLAKEECVAWPVFLLLLHLSISRNPAERRPIAVMFGLSLLAGLRVLWQTSAIAGSGAGSQAGLTPLAYLGAQGAAILRYLRLLLWPTGFTVDPEIAVQPDWLAWAFILAAAGFAAIRWFSGARPGFWIASALALLLPSSSIFPAQDLAADRRMYLPMAAVAGGAGRLLASAHPALVLAAGVVWCGLSIQRSNVWRSERELWEEARRQAPSKTRPLVQLARVLPPDEALPLLDAARRQAPNDPRIATELGRVYIERRDPVRALAEFGRALALDPQSAEAVSNRGVALFMLDQKDAARADFERALKMNPCFEEARGNLRRTGAAAPDPPPGCAATLYLSK